MSEEQPWRTVKLREILTEKQIRQLTKVMNKHRGKPTLTSELKKLLEPLAEQLEAKGVLPDYLAYYLTYAADKFPEGKPRNN